jgi:hypothetical protein
MTGRFLLLMTAALRALGAQQEVPADRARLADAVRTDLSKLTDLERTFFATNKRFTTDIKSLRFAPASGALISVSYASARTFSASASHVRLAPFLCFVIVSSADASSPAERPFCTDSRYGTAATALARAGMDTEPARVSSAHPPAVAAPSNVTPITTADLGRGDSRPAESAPAAAAITPAEFAERMRIAAERKSDSIVVVVQFAANDARYDPSREVLEVAIERVPMPFAGSPATAGGPSRASLACFTRPAFVCGASGLSYIARGIFRVPRSRAPDADVLRTGMTVRARFAIGHRDDTAVPSLTLLALVLQAKGEAVSRWETVGAP